VTSYPFGDLRADVARILGQTNYATMTTVDGRGRPRSRVLIVVWDLDGERPVGWLGTYASRVKVAHLAGNPHVTTSYWSPRHEAVYLDSVARWDDHPDVARDVWDRYRRGSPSGVGYDPGQFWTGPADSGFRVLRLDPWRLQVVDQNIKSRIWRPDRG
jgi:hypothetical protein